MGKIVILDENLVATTKYEKEAGLVMGSKPWEVHPSLTEERLIHLGSIVKDIRSKTVELYEPNEGDGPWSLGCRVYERTINAIEREAQKLEWLDTRRNGLYFLILVDGVPLRYHRGDVENPNVRTLQRHYPELEAEQIVFPFDPSQWFWRVIVETDEEGYAMRIVVVQYTDNGTYQNLWEVPISVPVSPITPVVHTPRAGVELEKPSVGAKIDRERKATAYEENE